MLLNLLYGSGIVQGYIPWLVEMISAGITKKINGSARTVKAREIYWTTAKAIIL